MHLPWGTASVWSTEVTLPQFPTIDELGELDVVIVGAGISGLTAALLLQRAGLRTALLEQHSVGCGETSRTTAHLTEYPDAGFARIATDFGREGAAAVAQSQRDAIGLIESFARDIRCDFTRVPGYLYTERESDRDQLMAELDAAITAACTVRATSVAPLPFPTAGAIEFPNQAVVHPQKYLAGLVTLYADAGGCLSEGSHVRAIDEDSGGCRVRTDRSVSYAGHVIAVTDAPITGGGLLDTKLRANRSYVIAFRVEPSNLPTGLFWDTEEPYHYIRTAHTDHGPVLLIGGEDHRTGTDAEQESFDAIERYARDRFNVIEIVQHWSGQIMEPVDGLPYIGARDSDSRVLIASGYGGNGMTFGTVAAQVLADIVRGVSNPYIELYAPNRMMAARQWAKYAAQNLPAAWTLVSEMLLHPRATSLEDLKPGEGRVVMLNGAKVAAARDRAGALHTVSPTCTHMGCDVAWNIVEQSWDCPCHGSRYSIDGRVAHGPATLPLEPLAALAASASEKSRQR
jgi:glycine/D-amino acid oxidase-like deaminating enzyme/nitrite reductase/ring-hydroxylating ferredoxin subunit